MLLFISDAHIGLGPEDEQRVRKDFLFECLDHYAPELDKLFILGDLFDFWFEWRRVIMRRHFQLLHKLRQFAERGIEIHFLAGNHDFALGSFLENEIGIQIHPNEYQFEYDHKRFYLMHGDGLAPADWGYRILKRIFRNRTNQKLFRLLPPDFSIGLADRCSHTSRNYAGRRWDIDGWAYLAAARKIIARGNDYVIFAHNHEPLIQPVEGGLYVNTGDWIRYFSYAVYEQGMMKLKYWHQPYLELTESHLKV